MLAWRWVALVALATTALTATGCSSHSPGSGGSGGGGACGGDANALDLCTVAKTAHANALIFLLAQSRCVDGQPPAFLDSLPDRDAQIAALRAECKKGDEVFDFFDLGISSGRVRFDSCRLNACLAKGKALRATPSPKVFDRATLDEIADDADCKGVWIPLVAENGTCVDEWDCPLETRCEPEDPYALTLKCLRPAGAGSPCGQFRTCDPTTLFCNAGVCTARVAHGGACMSDGECVTGAFCSAANICEQIPNAGAPCTKVCNTGLVCAGGICVPQPAPAADGAICDGTTCAGACSVCRPEHDGDPQSQFKCLPRGPDGSPCASDDSCLSGLYCRSITGHCEKLLAGGAACSDPSVKCQGNFECDGQTCVPLPGLGSPCVQGNCAAGLICSGPPGAETCQVPQVPPQVGEPCPSGSCADGAFCNPAGTCEAKRGAGDPCSDFSECFGECYKGRCTLPRPSTPPEVYSGCGDMRHDLPSLFGMGLLGVLARRRKHHGGGRRTRAAERPAPTPE